MDKISVAVVEDEEKERELLTEFFARFEKEKGVSISLTLFDSATPFLRAPGGQFDIVFMDIELPDMDGMTMAHRFREFDKSAVIIFVTNLAQYAVKGYEVHAFDFVIKPINYSNLALKLINALQSLKKKHKADVWITTKTDRVKLSSDDIMYIEVRGHSLCYHTAQGVFVCTGTLRSVENNLKNCSFSRCNSCYIVNLAYVNRISGFNVTVGSDVLLMSRNRRAVFLSDMNDYLASGGGAN